MSDLTKLRDICISLWPDVADARRLVDDAYIVSANMRFAGTPVQFWQSILSEADKQNELSKLTPILIAEYPKNITLYGACLPFLPVDPDHDFLLSLVIHGT